MKTKILCFEFMNSGLAIQGLIQNSGKVVRIQYADGTPIEANIKISKVELNFQNSRVEIFCEHPSWEDVPHPPCVPCISVLKETSGVVIE